ncbi:tumor necrosis factor-like isoform X1 [Carassius carassius]|uniref:tumor necrosis factor-like isoform X1 n=1 Tax=Carassius carassius TaxID=217509 RepID=UPI0028696997|nr:tumor necrosis factor-like isoform X1 [Carassius carassius]
MVKYETTLLDMEAGAGGVYQTMVAPSPMKSSRSWIWKTVAAIAFVTLCAVAAVFFAWHVTKQNQRGNIFTETKINTPSEQGKILKQIAERTKAAIHLRAGEHDSCLESESLKWVSGVDQSFEQGGLKLVGNKIHIPADGLYFVYSQVSYAILCNEKNEDDGTQKFLSHSIWRYTDAVEQWKPLQNSAHSICQSLEHDRTTYSTIYLGAVFKLMEGDKLSTKTTYVANVEEDYAKTFFGVFAL